MKQYISVDQLNELTPEQKERLREWWEPQKGDMYYYPKINHSHVIDNSYIPDLERIKKWYYPLLSVGQCIELLTSGKKTVLEIENNWFDTGEAWNIDASYCSERETELIDALWQAIKHVFKPTKRTGGKL